jgi:hypothetical protein
MSGVLSHLQLCFGSIQGNGQAANMDFQSFCFGWLVCATQYAIDTIRELFTCHQVLCYSNGSLAQLWSKNQGLFKIFPTLQ